MATALQAAAGVAGAMVVILTAASLGRRAMTAVVAAIRKITEIHDDWVGEPDRPGVPGRPGIMARVAALEEAVTELRAEHRPNGGHSMRDAVDQLRAEVATIRAELERRPRTVAAATRATR